jgi:hypothetical protein
LTTDKKVARRKLSLLELTSDLGIACRPRAEANIPVPIQATNGDEQNYSNFIGNFSKGLPHNAIGEVDQLSYRSSLNAVGQGTAAAFEEVPLGGNTPLVNPLAGVALDLEGTASHQSAIPSFPSVTSQGRWLTGRSSCTGRFWCARPELLERIGARLEDWRSVGEYDLVLRCTERAQGIRHVSRVLCERAHRRLTTKSTNRRPWPGRWLGGASTESWRKAAPPAITV